MKKFLKKCIQLEKDNIVYTAFQTVNLGVGENKLWFPKRAIYDMINML